MEKKKKSEMDEKSEKYPDWLLKLPPDYRDMKYKKKLEKTFDKMQTTIEKHLHIDADVMDGIQIKYLYSLRALKQQLKAETISKDIYTEKIQALKTNFLHEKMLDTMRSRLIAEDFVRHNELKNIMVLINKNAAKPKKDRFTRKEMDDFFVQIVARVQEGVTASKLRLALDDLRADEYGKK